MHDFDTGDNCSWILVIVIRIPFVIGFVSRENAKRKRQQLGQILSFNDTMTKLVIIVIFAYFCYYRLIYERD